MVASEKDQEDPARDNPATERKRIIVLTKWTILFDCKRKDAR